jgi:hypothetical protein
VGDDGGEDGKGLCDGDADEEGVIAFDLMEGEEDEAERERNGVEDSDDKGHSKRNAGQRDGDDGEDGACDHDEEVAAACVRAEGVAVELRGRESSAGGCETGLKEKERREVTKARAM